MSTVALTRLLVANAPMPPPDQAFVSWLGGPLRPPTRAAQDRTDAYLELVTAPSTPARACYLGALRDCRFALGLQSGGGRFGLWVPAAAQRRALLEPAVPHFLRHRAHASTVHPPGPGADPALQAF